MRRLTLLRATCIVALAALAFTPDAFAIWLWDQNQDRVDDRIDAVEAQGPLAAHVGGLATGRLRFALLQTTAPYVYGVYVGYDHHPTDTDAAALAALGVPVQVRYRSIDYIRSEVTAAQAHAIAGLPGITRVETIPALYAVNDIASRTMRARESEGELFPSVWRELGAKGRGIVVGILDTGANDAPSGLYPGHESLVGKFVGGGNFFSGQPELNTPIDESENPRHELDPEATYHGTHVAGTAIGTGGPSGQFAGIAPEAWLVDCKVLSDAGLGFGAADGLDWCVHHRDDDWGLTGADTVYRGVDVLNMSLGGTDNSDGTDASSAAVNAAVRAGIVVCVATGNDGNTNWIASPCAADLALSVGSFTDNNTLARGDDLVADYSNEGPRLTDPDSDHLDEMKPSVLGSGTGILSALGDPTTAGDRYHHINGTSMATPTVAGVVALMLSANPSLTPDRVRQILQNTADHRLDHGKQLESAVDPFGLDPNYHPSWGWGQTDAYAAVKEAQNDATTQLVRFWTTPQRGPDRMRLDWVSQREVGLVRYEVERADDVEGSPGAWSRIAVVPVPSPRTQIHRAPNRHAYSFLDSTGEVSREYWYRVNWRDGYNRLHVEPARRARIADSPVVARVRFSWTHNYSDGDLTVQYGSGTSTGGPVWFRMAPGAPAADSVVTVPGQPLLGTLRHYFHFDLTTADLVEGYLPPGAANPWFLSVREGGFINTKGTVNDFSVTTFDGSGSSTYTAPNPPTTTIEKTETVFWIPLDPVLAQNHAPVFTTVGPLRVREGLPMSRQIVATDADGQTLTYSALALPAGAAFDPGSRVLSWTPGYSQAGDWSAILRVEDGTGLLAMADTELVAITVLERAPGEDLTPTLDPLSDRQVLGGERVSLRITAHDPEGGPLTYSFVTPVPPSVVLDEDTGSFEWSATAGHVGVHEFVVRATDPGGHAVEGTFYVTVSAPVFGPPSNLACEEATTSHSGVVEMGLDPLVSSVAYQPFEIPSGTQRIEGSLTFALAPAVDLDFYLLDADSNVVQSAASTNAPEVLVVSNPAPGSYIWKVVAYANPDTAEFTIDQRLCVSVASGVPAGMRPGIRLRPAAPNPARGATTIAFAIPEAATIRLRVFDLAGRLVRTLHDGAIPAGDHRVLWDRRGDSGSPAAAGVYFCRLEAGGRSLGQKVVLLQ